MEQTTLCKLIIIEFKKMVAAKINFAPKPDEIQATAEIWIETICDEFKRADAVEIPRIQSAFSTIRKTFNKWPTPADLLKSLPRYPTQYYIGPPDPTDEEREAGKAAVRNIIKKLAEDK